MQHKDQNYRIKSLETNNWNSNINVPVLKDSTNAYISMSACPF